MRSSGQRLLQRQVFVMTLNQLSQESHQMDPGAGGTSEGRVARSSTGSGVSLSEVVGELGSGPVGGEDGDDVVEVLGPPQGGFEAAGRQVPEPVALLGA